MVMNFFPLNEYYERKKNECNYGKNNKVNEENNYFTST